MFFIMYFFFCNVLSKCLHTMFLCVVFCFESLRLNRAGSNFSFKYSGCASGEVNMIIFFLPFYSKFASK